MIQGELLPETHDSLQRDRLRKRERINPERIYAAAWKRINRRGNWRGASLLELVLQPSGDVAIPTVSRRDAEVAASVIQWLGTNVGYGFIRSCERAIDEARRKDDRARADANSRPSLLEAERDDARPPRRALALGEVR